MDTVTNEMQTLNALTKTERETLADCEADIETGRNMVGAALKTIRDERLYRATHGTFEEYIDDRWSFSKSQAYRSIRSCEFRQSLSSIGRHLDDDEIEELCRNDRRARALYEGVPDDRLPELLDRVAEHMRETGEAPTADVICQVKAKVISHDDQPAPDVPAPDDRPDTEDEAVEAELLEAPEPKPAKPKAGVEKRGPDSIRQAATAIVAAVSPIVRQVDALADLIGTTGPNYETATECQDGFLTAIKAMGRGEP